MADKHSGTCFCGAVEVEVTGAPEAMGYCHCRSCRSWSAGPVNAFTLWKPENVRVAKGAEFVGKFMKTPVSDRKFCTKCGGHLMTDHPPLGLVDVYAATIPSVDFVPGRPRELFRDRAADEGRAAQAQRLPGRAGRVGYRRAGVERVFASPVTRGRWPGGPEGESRSRDSRKFQI